ncbi:MAG: YiiX family permuted papain-like enzyme [Calditrichaeota bacterium]|nr:MAG: YiiX family permuted papain-like enzyme [Calditrichota bacterium]
MKKITIYLIIFIILSFTLSSFSVDLSNVKYGDIIFQNSLSRQSKAIELATHSKYTHVGIIFYKDSIPFVLEAVHPVTYTKLDQWIVRGVDDFYVIKRLTGSDSLLTSDVIQNMIFEGDKFLNKRYDRYFNWSDAELYCSELVWKVFERGADIELCELKKMKEYDLSNPIVKAVMQRRYGNNPPLEESMVSPEDIADSELLTEIYTSTKK